MSPIGQTETHNANRRTQRAQEVDSYQRLRGVELRPRSRCCPRRTECDDEKSVEGGGLIPPSDATIGFHGSWRISLTTDKGKTGDPQSNCPWRRPTFLRACGDGGYGACARMWAQVDEMRGSRRSSFMAQGAVAPTGYHALERGVRPAIAPHEAESVRGAREEDGGQGLARGPTCR